MRIGAPALVDRRRGLDRPRGEGPGPEHDRRLRECGPADRGRLRPGGDRRRHDRARRDRLAAGPGRPRGHGTLGVPGAPRQGRDHRRRGVQSQARDGREGDVDGHSRPPRAGPRGQPQNLAAGLATTNLYQGSSATGANIGGNPLITGIDNGYLPGVEGASMSPGSSYISGTKKVGPQFVTPRSRPGRVHRSSPTSRPTGSSGRSSSRPAAPRQVALAPGPGQLDPGRRGPADPASIRSGTRAST